MLQLFCILFVLQQTPAPKLSESYGKAEISFST